MQHILASSQYGSLLPLETLMNREELWGFFVGRDTEGRHYFVGPSPEPTCLYCTSDPFALPSPTERFYVLTASTLSPAERAFVLERLPTWNQPTPNL